MNQQIINTISSLLIKSPKTDQELSDMIGVSRVMIHKWKKCQVKKIRKSNLVGIAKAVNHELKILIDGSIELIPIDNQIETNENAVDSKDLVLKALDTSTMHNKWLQIELEEYKQKILDLEKQNIKLKENYKYNNFTLKEQIETYKLILEIDSEEITHCTQLFADLFNKSSKYLIGKKILRLINKKDVWRKNILVSLPRKEVQQTMMTRKTWIVGSDYMDCKFIMLMASNLIMIDLKKSTKDKYEKDNIFYKNLSIK